MALLLLNVALAAVPSVALVVYFYRRDSRQREPVALGWRTLLLGFLSVLPAAAAVLSCAPERAAREPWPLE